MSRLTWFQKVYWQHFSKPVEERALMLHLLQHPVASVLEIGIGSGERLQRVLPVLKAPAGVLQIRYVGVDLFEAAEEHGARPTDHLPLKSVHRLVSERGMKASLIPGTPETALPRIAQTLPPSDLVIIDAGWRTPELSECFAQWLPRVTTPGGLLFARTGRGEELRQVKVERTGVSSASKAA